MKEENPLYQLDNLGLMVSEIRVVELFAGVGGFRVGLEKCSEGCFKTIWANQWEPGSKSQAAFRCYDYHFHDSGSVNVNEDIAKVKDEVPEDFELLVGGFPCQDYSVASTHAAGIVGKKGVLWWELYHIIQNRRPKYIILENVDRLLKSPSSQRGRDFAIILRCLNDAGYYVEWRVINANDYGFVQRRRRVFIFACRKDSSFISEVLESSMSKILTSKGFFQSVFPVYAKISKDMTLEYSVVDGYSSLVSVSDEFSGRFYDSGVMYDGQVFTCNLTPKYHKKKDEGLLSTIVEGGADESFSQEKHLEKWIEMKGKKNILRVNKKTGIRYRYSEGAIPFPDPLDRPGRTMLTSEGSRNRSSHLIIDPLTGIHRTLTPEECERMNGFDEGWTSMLSRRQRYFTMGNALVVDLIKKMGDGIIHIEDSYQRLKAIAFSS